MRILLVEDNALNQMVGRAILEAEGMQVEVAGDGEQALAVLRRDRGFDLVLMDVQMPVLDGLAATRAIRAELALALPVIAMSAGVLATERALCLDAGMSDFLAKPLDAAQMFALIRRHAGAAAAPMVAGVFDVAALAALNERQPQRRGELFKLIERALAAAPLQIDAARVAWRGGDSDGAARQLHELRGALGALGARRFANLSLRLESALRQDDDGADLPALFEQATSALLQTVQCGSAWLATAGPRPGAS